VSKSWGIDQLQSQLGLRPYSSNHGEIERLAFFLIIKKHITQSLTKCDLRLMDNFQELFFYALPRMLSFSIQTKLF
jgi:hypothetical protein